MAVGYRVCPDNLCYLVCSIRYNIQYGRIGAADYEVEEAAAAADMHTRILTFPNGRCEAQVHGLIN